MLLSLLSLLACGGASKQAPEASASTAGESALPEVVQPPAPPANANELRLFLMSGSHHATAAELICPSGYRLRVPLEGGWARFEEVPAGEDCTVYFKGGAPANFEPVQGGQDLKCQISATTGVCAVQGS
ncbi:MAG: hypothetical protein H6741_14970 [Alphaproteobacteria bacterium]|nr:hypothetical protein [Alphaproteobacteria bacterium]